MAGNIFVGFFCNPWSKVAWSCRGSNPGPSDSQPEVLTTRLVVSLTEKKLKNSLSGPITGSFSVTFGGISVKIVLYRNVFDIHTNHGINKKLWPGLTPKISFFTRIQLKVGKLPSGKQASHQRILFSKIQSEFCSFFSVRNPLQQLAWIAKKSTRYWEKKHSSIYLQRIYLSCSLLQNWSA